jgi:short subunit dehydrogenase-like uncharacterized protein
VSRAVPEDRELDIALFGATGFTGRLVAGYLASHAPEGTRIGLAGRSEEKLKGIRDGLPKAAADWPLIVADSSDQSSLDQMAARARVVVTTVGPYARGGLPLVEACARAGTHYADLTGEPLFMRDSIDKYDTVARESGARIVHASGFDSIPSDIGTLLLHEQAKADGAGELEDTTLVVKGVKGGLSGGTLESLTGQIDETKADPARGKLVNDPYALSPDRSAEPDLGDERDLRGPEHDDELGMWVGPFVMAGVNTRVVRRSNALEEWRYGKRFRYREVMSFGSGAAGRAKATGLSVGLGATLAGMSFGPTRTVLKKVLPSAGEGPSEKMRESGFFNIDIHTRTSSGARYVCHLKADGDPGYKATSMLLGEAGLCLALDGDKMPDRAGVLTPATAMGTAVADRLRAAGMTLEVERA